MEFGAPMTWRTTANTGGAEAKGKKPLVAPMLVYGRCWYIDNTAGNPISVANAPGFWFSFR